MKRALIRRPLDPIQARLGEMEQARASSLQSREAIPRPLSTFRLSARTAFGFLPGRVRPIEQDRLKYVDAAGMADAANVADEAGVGTPPYSFRMDVSAKAAQPPSPSSSCAEADGYLALLWKARNLARQGDPSFELYLLNALAAYCQVWGDQSEPNPASAFVRLVQQTRDAFQKAIGPFLPAQVSVLMQGVSGLLEVIPPYRNQLVEAGGRVLADTLSFEIRVSVPGVSDNANDLPELLRFNSIQVSHETGSGMTVVERRALGISFARIALPDSDARLLHQLYDKLRACGGLMNGMKIVGYGASGESLLNFVGKWGGFLAELAGQAEPTRWTGLPFDFGNEPRRN